MSLPWITLFIAAFAAASMVYAFRYRGATRFANLREYVRKGWPVFTPLNCFLYLFTQKRAAKPIMDLSQFPELKLLEENWETIREEALALQEQQHFDNLNKPGEAAHYDVGFRTFYKYGWRKFYLKWYGYNHASALRLCPKTVEIVNQVKCINGAMFSILPPGSKLTRHLDPFACSLRYHLGLNTPNSDDCFISVDGQTYSWRDGKALLFDETYIHFVRNDTDSHRLILMCDVDRPMHLPGRIFNAFYKVFIKISLVPNTDEDKRGLANRILSRITPVLERGQQLKRSNRKLYKTIKFAVNTVIVAVLALGIWGLVKLFSALFSSGWS